MSSNKSNCRQTYKENQSKLLEKEHITDIKDSMDGLNSKLDTTEERLKCPELNIHNFSGKKKRLKFKKIKQNEQWDEKNYSGPIRVYKIE